MAHYGGTDGVAGMAVSRQIRWILAQPRVWILLVFFAAQFFNWMWVLTQADPQFCSAVYGAVLSHRRHGCGVFLPRASLRLANFRHRFNSLRRPPRQLHAAPHRQAGDRVTGADRIIGVCAVLCSTGAGGDGTARIQVCGQSTGRGRSVRNRPTRSGRVSAISVRTTLRNFRWVLCGWFELCDPGVAVVARALSPRCQCPPIRSAG